MKKRILLITSLIGFVAVQAQSVLLFKPASAHRLEKTQLTPVRATLSAEVTVRAAGRGNPWINLTDGRDLKTSRTPAEASSVEQSDPVTSAPAALASGDFDADGAADLAVGYAADGDRGMIILRRGSIDSIYPSIYDKSLGDSDAPFLDSARAVELPDAAELIAAGDFDADGHCDLIAAARDRSRMFLLRGDGKGGLGGAEPVELPGKITALTSGEFNRPDGLIDIVVAVSSADGPKVIVFEGPEGAAMSVPEVFDLPSVARTLALGRLDDDPWIDLVIGAGHEVLTVPGRDRQLSIDPDQRSLVHPAIIQRQSYPFVVESLVLGDFSGDSRLEIALTDRNGKVRLLERKEPNRGTALARTEPAKWRQISVLAEVINRSTASANPLVRARLSSLAKDNLLVLDQSRLQMRIVAFDGTSRSNGAIPVASPKRPLVVSIDANDEPVAALPMRLNADSVSDLVVLRRGQREPSLLITTAAMTFTVTSVADLPDASPGDGVCDIGTSICTLRAAIQEANATAGLDTINFSVGSGTPSIIIGGGGFGPLPLITDAVTINGNSGGATRVELNGSVAGPTATGLSISSGGSTVRSLVINRFAGGEIVLTNNGGNTIEGCIIGANSSGTAGFPNPGDGVSVSDSPGNTIGAASAAAGNLISANATGVHIDGPLSTGNRVQGNFIGTTLLGNAALANTTGVLVNGGASNNSIGGAVGVTRNVISGNAGDGVELGAAGNLVQQNAIGLDAGGSTDLGNTGVGVRTTANGNTVGGTSALAGNTISGNDSQGVALASNSNIVQGNFIGTNASGNASAPNAGDGVAVVDGTNNLIGGAASGARNLISGNGGHGVSLGGGSPSNMIIGNYIGVDSGGNAAIGNALSGVRVGSTLNTIGGVTPSARNIVSGNIGPGLLIATAEGTQNLVQGNFVGLSAAGNFSIANLSSGVSIDGASANMIGGTGVGAPNVISGNAGNGVQLINGSMLNHIEGNFIGTDSSGVGSRPNTGSGVFLSLGAGKNFVGGTPAGAGNTIAFNFIGGVVASSTALPGNAILGNSIRLNTALGIDLNADGITTNDLGDGDVGPNDRQNFPLLTSASSGGAGTVIVGNLNSTAGTVFRVEFFSNLNCDPAGNGEGQVLVGSTTVTTDGAGNGPVNVTLPTIVPGGRQLTATATDPGGSTSEFSPCILVVGSAGASADISVTKLANPDPVAAGNNITYTVRVTNSGPDEAIGAALTDNLPANTTFQSLLAAPGWTCTTPPAGGAGAVNCTHPDLLSGTTSTFVIAVQVGLSTPNGTIITNTASASSTVADPNPANNSAGTATLVAGSAPCVITCGPGLITVPTKGSECGATVKYPNVVSTGSCGAITCTPPSDSFFPVGTSAVTCTTAGGSSCSFAVRVEDRTPPLVTCPANFVQPLGPDQQSAVVNYPLPSVTDNCPGRSMVCSPPQGSTFPVGTTPVSCRVTDSANNVASCSFTVTVSDTQAPALSCPANIVINSQPGQCSPTVNYPAPTVTDNLPGATVNCAPPSGSAFTVGLTTVACTATDTSGNRTSCTFTVTLNGGPAQARITIPSGKPAVEFGSPVPIPAARKPAKLKKTPCSNFTIDNVGFTPLFLTFDSIRRIGSDVDSRKITDTDDSKIFTLSLVNPDQSLTPISQVPFLTIPPCQGRTFCVRFNPLIPGLAGQTTGLSADEVVPDTITSAIRFTLLEGAGVVLVNLVGHVETGLVLINPDNPRKAPLLSLSRSGDEFVVSYSLFDSNMDVKSAKYELLDGGGRLVGEAFDIDLAQPVRDLNLVRGQSFGVQQRFSGASSHPEVVAARLTVTDGQTSVTATVQIGQTSAAAAALVSYLRFGAVVVFPEALSLTR